MGYEKKYKESLEKAKKIYNETEFDYEKGMMAEIFPELAESEDERIRKELIEHCKNQAKPYIDTGNECPQIQSWIAWLEKQESVEEIVSRCKTSWYNEGKIQGQIEGLSDEEKYQQGWHDALEKQGDIDKSSYEIAEKEKRGFVGEGFIKCCANFQDFKEGETYWLEYVGNDSYNVRSDNLLGKTYHITPCQLYTIFKKLTWLEKQSKQKPVFEMKTPEESLGIYSDTYNKIVDECIYGEQKPTDKVEPKFKVGDWIISAKAHEDYRICKITNIDNGYYTIESIYGYKGYNHFNVFEESYRLWTIQDAKDGDVLATKSGRPFIFKCFDKFHSGCPVAYCGIDDIDDFIVGSGNHWWTGEEVQPATKEQRDLLFQNMKEAGYEWDDDKKELLEIKEELTDFENSLKHIMIETLECGDTRNLKADAEMLLRIAQKPKEWSEEDETMLNDIDITFFEEKSIPNVKYWKFMNWLKSIKERIGG